MSTNLSNARPSLNLQTPIVVAGLGKTGEALLRLLTQLGFKPDDIFCLDEKSISGEFKFEGHSFKLFSDPQQMAASTHLATLVVSPGIPLSSPWIVALKNRSVHITSELEIAQAELTSEKIISITGSLGKSTTTSLIGAGLQQAGIESFAGGNLGTPLATYVWELKIGRRRKAEWLVLELSSYQLENYNNLKCDVSILTYLSPNHLERYDSLEQYYQTKLHLIGLTRKLVVYNKQSPDLVKQIQMIKTGLQTVGVDRSSAFITKRGLQHNSLVGSHNLDNIAMAAAVGEHLSFPESYFTGLKQFQGLSHRFENAGLLKGIQFINDSKATTIDSVLQAVESLKAEKYKNKWVMIGGHDKGLNWQDLHSLKNIEGIQFLFFGEVAERARQISNLSGPLFKSFKDVLNHLPKVVKPQDVVLLSPGGTSHDEFKNFEERGDFFKSRIQTLFK